MEQGCEKLDGSDVEIGQPVLLAELVVAAVE